MDQQSFIIIKNSSFIEFIYYFILCLANIIKKSICNLYKINIARIKDILQTIPKKILFITDI
jgi:hypothetical protein